MDNNILVELSKPFHTVRITTDSGMARVHMGNERRAGIYWYNGKKERGCISLASVKRAQRAQLKLMEGYG